ncbi:hypothetical protein M5K25_022933 [Dendrobium thyrsiflorum]|uniref:Proteasome alpha-type subunits domain-containing protein n=1 Tax=Dendrobium thyrsiflorum TaxID=117978 RepID=A0ABD0U732_DENTH
MLEINKIKRGKVCGSAASHLGYFDCAHCGIRPLLFQSFLPPYTFSLLTVTEISKQSFSQGVLGLKRSGFLVILEMFLTRTEYDRGVNTFSPEGRLFQVEYAIEAIKLGSTAIGIKTKQGVVLAVEKRVTSPLLEPSSVEKIMEIDENIGCAMSGLIADARTLVEHARVETQNHRFSYGEPMTVESTTQALCDLALRFGEGDEESMSRPFGVSLLIAGHDEHGPNPSGTFWQCSAKAIGSGSEGADSSLQEQYNKASYIVDMALQEAETVALSILKQVMEEKVTPNNVDIAKVAPTYHLYSPSEHIKNKPVISLIFSVAPLQFTTMHFRIEAFYLVFSYGSLFTYMELSTYGDIEGALNNCKLMMFHIILISEQWMQKGTEYIPLEKSTYIRYCLKEMVKAASWILHEMANNGCFPNVFTCNILLQSLWKEGRAWEAEMLSQKKNETGYSMDIVSSNIMWKVRYDFGHEDPREDAPNKLEQ